MPATYNTEYVAVTPEPGRRKKYKKKKPCLVYCLCFLLVIALFAIAALVGLLVYTNFGSSIGRKTSSCNEDKLICNTPACVSAASRIIQAMDRSVEPCDDFYRYSCGGWMSKQLIPEYSSSYTTFSELGDAMSVQLKYLLEEPTKPGEHSSVQYAKNFYQSCKDDDVLTQLGDEHFKSWIKSEFGGWPMLESNWTGASFNFSKIWSRAARNSVAVIVNFGVAPDVKNSSKHILYMDQTSTGMPGQKYYLVPRNDSMLMAYENYIYNVANQLGLPNPVVGRKEVQDMVDFEIKLAKILVPSEERRDNNALYNPMTLGDIQDNYSNFTNSMDFDFVKIIESMFSLPEVGIMDIDKNETVINRSPIYYQRLGKLMESTSQRTIANYMVARVVLAFVKTLTPKYREFRQEYVKAVLGASREQRRDIYCSSMASQIMDLAVGRGFVKKYFDPAAKSEALGMINMIQSSFDDMIDDVDWMIDATKFVAKEKNEAIVPRIGYSENINNDTLLDKKFVNLTFSADKYFENLKLHRRLAVDYMLRNLRKPVDKEEWFSRPQTINAYYSANANQIMFPAGILQPPFFKRDFPKAVNYGAIGTVIGHEITHGFDDRGRQYDKDGNMEKWWDEDAIDKFKERAQCLINQYDNYTVTMKYGDSQVDMNLNGIKTQGENIADNGGVKASFRAYRKWVELQGKEEATLPGVNLTNNQLFFTAFAQVWCSLDTNGGLINRIRSGAHSPGQFRVTGSVQNSRDFAKAFNCPVGSPMNPVHKCSVW